MPALVPVPAEVVALRCAVYTLMNEVCGVRVADWGVVNDALCSTARFADRAAESRFDVEREVKRG